MFLQGQKVFINKQVSGKISQILSKCKILFSFITNYFPLITLVLQNSSLRKSM